MEPEHYFFFLPFAGAFSALGAGFALVAVFFTAAGFPAAGFFPARVRVAAGLGALFFATAFAPFGRGSVFWDIDPGEDDIPGDDATAVAGWCLAASCQFG